MRSTIGPGRCFRRRKEITLTTDGRCVHVLSLMQEGKLQPSRLVTHRLHYSDMVQAYEMAYHREKNMLNVVFNWKD